VRGSSHPHRIAPRGNGIGEQFLHRGTQRHEGERRMGRAYKIPRLMEGRDIVQQVHRWGVMQEGDARIARFQCGEGFGTHADDDDAHAVQPWQQRFGQVRPGDDRRRVEAEEIGAMPDELGIQQAQHGALIHLG
jgi:hypothetical protein